jgi:hypothetical protein
MKSALNGESKTTSVGSVSRAPAVDSEGSVVKSLNQHLVEHSEKSLSEVAQTLDRKAMLEQIARVEVHKDRIRIRLRSNDESDLSEIEQDQSFSIPWQEAAIQEIPVDPFAARRFATRRETGAGRATRALGERHRPRPSLAGRNRLAISH